MYHYEFGGENYRPDRPTRMVETPVTAQSATPAAVPVDSQPRYEQRMVKTTASMSSDAFFDFDKSRLTPAARSELDTVIATLKKSGYSGNLHLSGHTCNIGTEKYNQKLSERRALAVKKYLVEQGGIPEDAIIAEGKGELDPTYSNATLDSRKKNRRVDLEFVTYADKAEEVELPPLAPAAAPSPAKVQWTQEVIDVEPYWLRRALHNTTPHKESVDVYRQQETVVSVAAGDKQYRPNHAPVAHDDVFSVSTNHPTVLAVLANDSDPDGDPLTIDSYTQPGTGSLSSDGNGNLIFTPEGIFPYNKFKTTTFSYTISDGKGGTAFGSVTLIDP
jgi:outer membrane protein OmpA-like peptidoglycan-associated protein